MILLLFMVLLSPGNVYGDLQRGISFSDAGRMAVEVSRELENEYAQIAMREGIWSWGIRSYMPRLSIMASQDDRLSYTGPDSFLKTYSLNIEQMVWDGGRLSMSRKVERAELDLADILLSQMASQIREAAVSSYRDVLYTRMLLEIRNSSLASLEEQVRIMEREVELGLSRAVDLLDAEIRVAAFELEIISLYMDLEEAERNFAILLGLDELPPLTERIDTQRNTMLPSPEFLRTLVESRNPDLAVMRYSVSRTEAESRAASLSWLPVIRLTGSFGLSGRQYPLSRHNWSIGINIDFTSPWISGSFGAQGGWDPPFDNNARIQQTLSPVPDPASSFSPRAARLALANEQYRYETSLREAENFIDRLHSACLVYNRRRLLAMEALELERERYNLAEFRLTLGEITRLDLMQARLDFSMKEAALVEAAVMQLQAERALELFLDLGPGEISLLADPVSAGGIR